MKYLKAVPLVVFGLLFFFGLGGFLLHQAAEILGAGEVTYTRRPHPPVTVTAQDHPFSYYYQVLYFASWGAHFVLIGVSLLLYGVAKLLRAMVDPESATARRLYDTATRVVIAGVALFLSWAVLHMLRYWLVA